MEIFVKFCINSDISQSINNNTVNYIKPCVIKYVTHLRVLLFNNNKKYVLFTFILAPKISILFQTFPLQTIPLPLRNTPDNS